MADPHVEVGVDPGCGENPGSGGNFTGYGNGFAGGECAEVLIALDPDVKFAQEPAAVARVIFPSVFAVEKKTDGERVIDRHAFTEMTQPIMEICRGFLCIHAAVNETDEVCQVVVPKQSGDALRANLH